MELTNEQLSDLEQMGSVFLTIKECAIALDVNYADFEIEMLIQSTPAFKAYWKGVLNAKVKHAQSVNELAQRGSSPAQAMVQKMIERLDWKNI